MSREAWAALEASDRLSTFVISAKNRNWSRLSKQTGLTWEEAREFGYHLRGTPEPQAEPEEPPSKETAKGGVKVEAEDGSRVVTARGRTIRTLDELLDAAGVDRKLWRVSKWVANKWDGQVTGGDPVELWQVKAWLERRPDWSLNPIRPIRHLKRKRFSGGSARECALIVPDSQNGYRWRGNHDVLEPLHDRRAWDVAVQIAHRLQPSTIILLGDMLDLAPWSTKFARGANLANTTQPSIVELHWWLGQLRLASPGARIIYLEGNHEDRIAKALKQLLTEADGIRPADDQDGDPILSIQRLLALDSLDVEYVGPYDSEHWLWNAIRVHHGETVRAKGGATVSAIVREATHSDVVGHIHRLELACRTLHGPDGPRVIWALSPGTLTRIDGIVPAGTSRVDWQQGLAVIERTAGGQMFPSLLPIEDGRCVFCREVIEGRDRVADIREATGWKF